MAFLWTSSSTMLTRCSPLSLCPRLVSFCGESWISSPFVPVGPRAPFHTTTHTLIDPSRLILHVHAPSRLISPLTEVYFSRFVTHVIAHPISLFAHLATEFNLPPPPASDEAKFWNIFIPLRERYHGVSSVIYGSNGKGNGSESEFVLEVISRGKEGTGKRKAVSRNLHGWDKALQKCCELNNLNGLLPYFKPKVHTVSTCSLEPHIYSDALYVVHPRPNTKRHIQFAIDNWPRRVPV